MKTLYYTVVRGDLPFVETSSVVEARKVFEDLLLMGFPQGNIPDSNSEKRLLYNGPPIGLFEYRSKCLDRALGHSVPLMLTRSHTLNSALADRKRILTIGG